MLTVNRFATRLFRVCSFAGLACLAAANAGGALVDRATLADAGLVRAWLAQTQLDVARGGTLQATVHGGVIYALSSTGMLQAFDASTGSIRWTNRIGNPSYNSLGPAVQDTPDGVRIGIANGANVYLLDGENGQVIRSFSTPGAPGAPPAIAGPRLFVPMVDGRILGLPLATKLNVPWNYTAAGEIYNAPVAAKDRVLWTTSYGYLYSAMGEGGVRYRFRASAPLIGPAAVGEAAYVPTTTGLLYGIDIETGRQLWRASTGGDVRSPAITVGDTVYVGTEPAALHAYSTSGEALWSVEGVNRFVSASSDRVYAVSPNGRLAVIETGAEAGKAKWIGQLDAKPITNRDDDRLFLVSSNGLIQCLHELGRDGAGDEQPADQIADDSPQDSTETDPGQEAADESPFAEVPAPEETAESDDPFASDPFADEPAADDPFASEPTDDEPEDEEPADSGFDDFGGEEDPFADPFN